MTTDETWPCKNCPDTVRQIGPTTWTHCGGRQGTQCELYAEPDRPANPEPDAEVDENKGALSREPGHGGFFVPPKWMTKRSVPVARPRGFRRGRR